MDAPLGADRQRREARLVPDFVGHELIDGDVSMRTVLRLRIEDARKKGMHREVPALHAVIETAINGHVLAHVPQRLEQRGLLIGGARGLGEELFHLITEQISYRDESPRAGPGTFGGLHGGIAADGTGEKRWEGGESQGCPQRFEDEAAPVHGFHARRISGRGEWGFHRAAPETGCQCSCKRQTSWGGDGCRPTQAEIRISARKNPARSDSSIASSALGRQKVKVG
jgi:hypothetical protein